MLVGYLVENRRILIWENVGTSTRREVKAQQAGFRSVDKADT